MKNRVSQTGGSIDIESDISGMPKEQSAYVEKSMAMDCRHVLHETLDMLIVLEEYMSNRADVEDGDYGQPKPNEEMKLQSELLASIEKIEKVIKQ
jgi:hypothetical protein